MFKVFRRIRQQLLSETKFSRYTFYALGEIILVVIGILIALQVNNWNTHKNEQKEIQSYFKKIRIEISDITGRFKFLDAQLTKQYKINRQSLVYIKSSDRDSLSLLKNTLGTLGVNVTTNFSSPIMEEFFEKGLLSKVQNENTKYHLERFKAATKRLNNYDTYLDAQYVNSIEPFFYKRINYAEVTGDRRNLLVSGGPKTNYTSFQNDLELWNIITFKIEAIEEHQKRLKAFLKGLDILDTALKNELND